MPLGIVFVMDGQDRLAVVSLVGSAVTISVLVAGAVGGIANAVAAGGGLLGGGLCACGLIWDPARGRKRCPRCWYDMAGAAPGPGAPVICPECGRAIIESVGLLRTRASRPIICLGVIVFLACTGWLVFRDNHRNGWWRFLPTAVLVRVLPDGDARAWNQLEERLEARKTILSDGAAAHLEADCVRLIPGVGPLDVRVSAARCIRWLPMQHTVRVQLAVGARPLHRQIREELRLSLPWHLLDDRQGTEDQLKSISQSVDPAEAALAQLLLNEAGSIVWTTEPFGSTPAPPRR